MKELERNFGCYVSWNCSRLASGDYIFIYTRSHDMCADIHTKGFNDHGLWTRLCLLTNLYSPSQWKAGELRPAPILADKSSAIGSEGFDSSMINSQWPLFIMGGSTRAEDNRKAIKKKKPKKKQNTLRGVGNSLCPNVGGSENAYRVDFGVTAYQTPAEDAFEDPTHLVTRGASLMAQRGCNR